MMEVRIELRDQDDAVHRKFRSSLGVQATLGDLVRKIESVWNIDQKYQELFSEDGTQLDGLGGRDSLQSMGVEDGHKLIVKHTALEDWVTFLSYCDIVNDTKEDGNNQRAAARLAIDLSAKLESSQFFRAYLKFGTTFLKKHDEAMRLIDRLPAFEESAKEFFALRDPESTVEFEAKTVGIMSGTIAKVTKGDTMTRYYLKAHHRSGTAKVRSTSDRFKPDPIETFVYRLLNYIDSGPIVYFPYYSKSIYTYFIMTKQVDGFREFEQVNDAELKIKIVVEAYILRLILGITDLNSGNFGVDERNILSIIDFRPPRGDSFLQRDITDDFKNRNRIDEFDVNEILREVMPEKRIEIAKAALDRWNGIRTVTSNLIDDEIVFLRRHGIDFDDGTHDVEKYIEDIKANFETLRLGLQ